MPTAPSFSLLVPCYNAAPYLPSLAASLRAMTVPFDHVLCYDDGSTDDTADVARSLGLQILSPNPNGGVSRARNRLAEAASTEWIHFQDADDSLHPEFLARLAPLASADADVVSCDADWINERDHSLQITWRYDADQLARDAAAHLLARPMSLNNTLLRRESWLAVGGCDERLAMWEDADVHFRLALSGARWRHRPEVLTQALRRADSFSHDYRRNWRCRLQSLAGYARLPQAARLRHAVAAEAETCAANLVDLGDLPAAEEALRLAVSLGRDAPTTNSFALRVAKLVLPRFAALRLQRKARSKPRPDASPCRP